MIRRGKVFVRHSQAEKATGSRLVMMFGIVEADRDIIEEDVVYGVGSVAGAPRTLIATGHAARPKDEDFAYSAIDTLEGILRSSIWPRPRPSTGMQGGGLLFRRTRAPAAEGRETWIIVGAMSTDIDAYGDATLHDISGSLPAFGNPGAWLTVSNARPCPIPTNGSTPSQILTEPIWGWDDEPWGLYSALRLDAQDVCMELMELRHRSQVSQADETVTARIAELERHPAAEIVRPQYRDREYNEFRAMLIDRMGVRRWDRVRTQAALDEEDAICMDIIRSMEDAA